MATPTLNIADNVLKYLIVYPFLPLTISKVVALILYVLSIGLWHTTQWKFSSDSSGTVIPIIDLISIALLLITLWFTLQKFYWRKLEMAIDLVGFLLCLCTTSIIFSNRLPYFSILDNIGYNHILLLISWSFNVIWTTTSTTDTISKLLIPNWGEATEDIEIEALENHF